MKDLKKELDEKIHNTFKDHKAYLDYLLQTKKNFIYRYLETSTDKDIAIETSNEKNFLATSYEPNMGEAFKTLDLEIKEGIKQLAKTFPPKDSPKVRYQLKTEILDLRNENGKIKITAEVNWGFPEFASTLKTYKEKEIIFNFMGPAVFRKELAKKYEEACEIFV